MERIHLEYRVLSRDKFVARIHRRRRYDKQMPVAPT